MSGDGAEFPVPFRTFAKTLKGTSDEIWTKLLQVRHVREKHTPTAWRELLESHRHEPAYPGVK